LRRREIFDQNERSLSLRPTSSEGEGRIVLWKYQGGSFKKRLGGERRKPDCHQGERTSSRPRLTGKQRNRGLSWWGERESDMKEGRKEGRKKEVMVERRAAIADTSSITYRSVIGFINHSLLTAFVGVLLSTRVFTRPSMSS
jgi:hypothetical protein